MWHVKLQSTHTHKHKYTHTHARARVYIYTDCDLIEIPILQVETVICVFLPVQTKLAVSTGKIDNLTN